MLEPRYQHQAHLGYALMGSIEHRQIQRKPQETPCFLRFSLFLYTFPATNSHVDQAAEWTDTYGTFMNPEIAKTAIPYCNIVCITGNEMREKLSGFLKIINAMDPEAVGGKLPDSAFYYIP